MPVTSIDFSSGDEGYRLEVILSRQALQALVETGTFEDQLDFVELPRLDEDDADPQVSSVWVRVVED